MLPRAVRRNAACIGFVGECSLFWAALLCCYTRAAADFLFSAAIFPQITVFLVEQLFDCPDLTRILLSGSVAETTELHRLSVVP